MTTILGQELIEIRVGYSNLSHYPVVRFADPSLPQREFEAKPISYSPKPKPLPPEKKAAWLARLRDPNERQTKSKLCVILGDGTKCRCCLGIYAEISNVPFREKEDRVGWVEREANIASTLEFMFPDTDWGGITYDSALLGGDLKEEVEGAGFLADLNDSGWTFPEIAALIEKVY